MSQGVVRRRVMRYIGEGEEEGEETLHNTDEWEEKRVDKCR